MTSDDYEQFVEILRNLATVYGKKLDDGQIKFYWNALKDRPLKDIERRAEAYGAKGKFFPKPRDIRPIEATAEVVEESAESKRRWEQAEREIAAAWDQRLKEDPLKTKLDLCVALEARYSVEKDQGSTVLYEKREWLNERRRALIEEAIKANRPELILSDFLRWRDVLGSPDGYKLIDRCADLAAALGRAPFLSRAQCHREATKRIASEAA